MQFRDYIIKDIKEGWKEEWFASGKYPDKWYQREGASVWFYDSKSATLWWYNPKEDAIFKNNKRIIDGENLPLTLGRKRWTSGNATHFDLESALKNHFEAGDREMVINGRSYSGNHQAWYLDFDNLLKQKKHDIQREKALKAAERYIK